MSLKTAIHAPRGTALRCQGWHQEAALRMLHNNLDPEVAENPDALVVYGGIGKAARDWDCFEAILKALRKNNYNRTETAKELAISRRALTYKLQRLRAEGVPIDPRP